MVWVNLSAEPVLFIDGSPFVLRDYFHSFRVLREFEVVHSAARLSEIEQRLKVHMIVSFLGKLLTLPQSDTVLESEQSEGSVLLHLEMSKSRIRPEYIQLGDASRRIRTTVEIFDDIGVNHSDMRSRSC